MKKPNDNHRRRPANHSTRSSEEQIATRRLIHDPQGVLWDTGFRAERRGESEAALELYSQVVSLQLQFLGWGFGTITEMHCLAWDGMKKPFRP